jgi:predicted nuclease with TOPRIM domain
MEFIKKEIIRLNSELKNLKKNLIPIEREKCKIEERIRNIELNVKRLKIDCENIVSYNKIKKTCLNLE